MAKEYYDKNPEARLKHNEYCRLKAAERYRDDEEYRERQKAKSKKRYEERKLKNIQIEV